MGNRVAEKYSPGGSPAADPASTWPSRAWEWGRLEAPLRGVDIGTEKGIVLCAGDSGRIADIRPVEYKAQCVLSIGGATKTEIGVVAKGGDDSLKDRWEGGRIVQKRGNRRRTVSMR